MKLNDNQYLDFIKAVSESLQADLSYMFVTNNNVQSFYNPSFLNITNLFNHTFNDLSVLDTLLLNTNLFNFNTSTFWNIEFASSHFFYNNNYVNLLLEKKASNNTIILKKPNNELKTLSKCLERKSVRNFKNKILTLNTFQSILFWSFHHKNCLNERGFNHYASAGGLYPIDVYILVNNVKGLDENLYYYDAVNHTLKNQNLNLNDLDITKWHHIDNFKNFHNNNFVCFFVWNSNINELKYSISAISFAYIEAGEMLQNLDLVLNSYGLGMCQLGGFNKQYLDKLICKNSLFSNVIATCVVGINGNDL